MSLPRASLACLLAGALALLFPGPPRLVAARIVHATAPAKLLLGRADLPSGAIADDALANPAATALVSAYKPIIVASAFAGFLTPGGAVVQMALALRSRDDVGTLIGREATAARKTPGAALLTLDRRYGEGATLAYVQRGAHGEHWVVTLVAAATYVVEVGVAGPGQLRQSDIVALEHLAARVEARERIVVTIERRLPPPILRLTLLTTQTKAGKGSNTFRARAAIYWRIEWQSPAGDERVDDALSCGKTVLYRNALRDKADAGVNAAVDHALLPAGRGGQCVVTVTIRVGRSTVHAAHSFTAAKRSS